MKRVLFSLFIIGFIFVVGGCNLIDTVTEGACVMLDYSAGTNSCMNDYNDNMCDDSGDTLFLGMECSEVGYPYLCTYDDMVASGASVAFYISHYLDNASCNPEL